MAMLRHVLVWLIVALLVSLPGAGSAADLCARPIARDVERAPLSESCNSDHFRLAEGSSKTCTDSCISQCRKAERNCSGSGCRAQFQICARKCVVSCGSR
jgi:hypothetical protein